MKKNTEIKKEVVETILNNFSSYWKKSSHPNINEAIKGFLRSKKYNI